MYDTGTVWKGMLEDCRIKWNGGSKTSTAKFSGTGWGDSRGTDGIWEVCGCSGKLSIEASDMKVELPAHVAHALSAFFAQQSNQQEQM